VARNEAFIQFSKDLPCTLAAMAPQYIKKEDVPADMVAGGADAAAISLLGQPFVKDASKSVQDLLNELIANDRREHRDRPFHPL